MILTSEPVPAKCCDKPHAGMTCADGLTQCCLCYKRFVLADLYVGADGWTWDYCKVCAERDAHLIEEERLLLSEYEARASYHWNGKR